MKIAALVIAFLWACYLTWETHRAVRLAAEACAYAADTLNDTPGPGLDSTHRDVRMVCE